MKTKSNRIPEIDSLRGLAVIGMILYHAVFVFVLQHVFFDYDFFRVMTTFPVQALGVFVRVTFITLVGVSSWLLFTAKKDSPVFLQTVLKRTIHIILASFMVTIASFIYMPQYVVLFGVLHFIALSVVAVLPFLFFPRALLPLGFFLIVSSFMFSATYSVPTDFSWLIKTQHVSPTLDYFPFLNWFGLVLVGAWVGWYVYGTKPQKKLPKALELTPTVVFLQWIGKNALPLYIIHVPIIFLLAELIQLF